MTKNNLEGFLKTVRESREEYRKTEDKYALAHGIWLTFDLPFTVEEIEALLGAEK
jgi:hypothetical protein